MSDSTSPGEVETNNETPLPVEYDDLRKQDVPSDFTIKLGEESFLVHRKTITTHSEYFRAMLEHDTKENEQGLVDINEIPMIGVKECVEYMYTGSVNVNAETVEDILKTADMWQLSKVKDVCGKFLEEKLDTGNCVSTVRVAGTYSFSDLEKRAQTIYNESFDTDLPELLRFEKDDFIEILKTRTLGNEVAWDAIINWIKHDSEKRSESVSEFMNLLDWNEFPSSKLLQRLWDEPLVRNDLKCKEFLFEKLFLDLKMFNSNISIKNYFVLKTLSQEFKYVIKEIKDVVSQFIKTNFFLLSTQADFKYLNAEEFVFYFTDDASRGLVSEESRWNIMMNWINHDRSREVYFSTLMETIRFNRLSKSFVKSVVRDELLAARECSSAIVDGLFSQVMFKNTEVSVIVLYSDGRIRALNSRKNSWKDLVNSPEPLDNAEIFHFNGKICLINGSKLFYLQDDIWIERRSISSERTGQKKIATHDDFVYVVCSGMICCYASLLDSWSYVALPSEIDNISSLAATDEYVYIHESQGYYKKVDWRYNIRMKEWQFREIREFSNFLVVDDEIYTCDGGHMRKYESEGSMCWNSIQLKNQTSKRSSCGFSSSMPTLSNINGKIIRVNKTKIEAYDDLSKQCNTLSDIPVYSKGLKGQEIEINMISACALLTDEKDM